MRTARTARRLRRTTCAAGCSALPVRTHPAWRVLFRAIQGPSMPYPSKHAEEPRTGLCSLNPARCRVAPAGGSRTGTPFRTSLILAAASALRPGPHAAVRSTLAQTASGCGRRVKDSQSTNPAAGGGGAAMHNPAGHRGRGSGQGWSWQQRVPRPWCTDGLRRFPQRLAWTPGIPPVADPGKRDFPWAAPPLQAGRGTWGRPSATCAETRLSDRRGYRQGFALRTG